jgi:hypothetical protein
MAHGADSSRKLQLEKQYDELKEKNAQLSAATQKMYRMLIDNNGNPAQDFEDEPQVGDTDDILRRLGIVSEKNTIEGQREESESNPTNTAMDLDVEPLLKQRQQDDSAEGDPDSGLEELMRLLDEG